MERSTNFLTFLWLMTEPPRENRRSTSTNIRGDVKQHRKQGCDASPGFYTLHSLLLPAISKPSPAPFLLRLGDFISRCLRP